MRAIASAGSTLHSFVDRPNNCVAQTTPAQPAGTCLLGGGSHSPGARTDANAVSMSPDMIEDNSIVSTDKGRAVTGNGIPAGAYVGRVTDTPTTATAANGSPGGAVDVGTFELVNSHGHPINITGPVSGVTLAAETNATDPLFDATDPTTGGGDTGSVLT
jgi:hypothetical protein